MATINGTAGNDFIIGTSSDDFIYGFNGNDELHGGKGADFIIGGLGRDVLDGGNDGTARDILRDVEPGSDALSNSADIFHAGPNDYVLGGRGGAIWDSLAGRLVEDRIFVHEAGPQGYGNLWTDIQGMDARVDVLYIGDDGTPEVEKVWKGPITHHADGTVSYQVKAMMIDGNHGERVEVFFNSLADGAAVTFRHADTQDAYRDAAVDFVHDGEIAGSSAGVDWTW